MPRALLCVLGAVASAIVACGGRVTETPAELAGADAAAPDAAFDSGDGEGGVRLLGAGQCRETVDCTFPGDTACLPPGTPLGGGPCRGAPPCASDGECRLDGGDLICDVTPDDCPRSPKSCIPGCMGPADCGVGEVCVLHRCAPLSCQSAAQCPTDFACGGGTCARKTCTDDTPCSGYCVRGQCYSAPGYCPLLIPP
jgi:hypothetical protein